MEVGKVTCPKCRQIVDRIDHEYARHYVVATVVCTMSRRELRKEDYEAVDKKEALERMGPLVS